MSLYIWKGLGKSTFLWAWKQKLLKHFFLQILFSTDSDPLCHFHEWSCAAPQLIEQNLSASEQKITKLEMDNKIILSTMQPWLNVDEHTS